MNDSMGPFCSETDEDFIEEMFSEVGMAQDHDGFHVV